MREGGGGPCIHDLLSCQWAQPHVVRHDAHAHSGIAELPGGISTRASEAGGICFMVACCLKGTAGVRGTLVAALVEVVTALTSRSEGMFGGSNWAVGSWCCPGAPRYVGRDLMRIHVPYGRGDTQGSTRMWIRTF